MKLTLFAVGHKGPTWINAGCAEYLRRMPHELSLSIVEIRPEAGEAKTRLQRLAAEKTRLLAALGVARTWQRGVGRAFSSASSGIGR